MKNRSMTVLEDFITQIDDDVLREVMESAFARLTNTRNKKRASKLSPKKIGQTAIAAKLAVDLRVLLSMATANDARNILANNHRFIQHAEETLAEYREIFL